ncbi:unnamed protein product, partial [marine sediment metagenome]
LDDTNGTTMIEGVGIADSDHLRTPRVIPTRVP